eukprot:COSAG03_NODE_1461_length_4042_cov_2.075323_7_plen_37_part_01
MFPKTLTAAGFRHCRPTETGGVEEINLKRGDSPMEVV